MTWQLTLEDLDPALWSKLQLDMWEEIKAFMFCPSQYTYANLTMNRYQENYVKCLSCFTSMYSSERGSHVCNKYVWRTSFPGIYDINTYITGFTCDQRLDFPPVDNQIQLHWRKTSKNYKIGGGIPYNIGGGEKTVFFIRYRVYPKVVVCQTYDHSYRFVQKLHNNVVFCRKIWKQEPTINSTFVVSRTVWDKCKAQCVRDANPDNNDMIAQAIFGTTFYSPDPVIISSHDTFIIANQYFVISLN